MESIGARTVADFLISDFENEMKTTLSVIEAVPSDHLDYRPDSKSKTGLGLVRHITLEDEWLLNCIANGEFTPPPDDSDACGIMNTADAVARYKEKVPAALDRVRGMSGEKLLAVLDMFGVIKMKSMYGRKVRGIERSTFVLDEKRRVVREWRGVKVPGHVQEVLNFVKAL